MTTLTLATWNIRKAVGLDRRRDPMRVLGAIGTFEADIVALQEADRRLGPRPSALPLARIEEETGLRPLAMEHSEVSLGWHGNALLVRPDAETGDVEHLELPGLEPRGAVIADLTLKSGAIRIVATHLGLLRRNRRTQLGIVMERLRQKPPLPTIVLGDFNEWSPQTGLEPLREAFTIHSPGLSFHAARPVAALDRIALESGIELRDAGVHRTPVTRVASDHLPVWARARIAG